MERDNKELTYTFGKKLKIAMTERGITNKQLAANTDRFMDEESYND